MNAWPDLHCTGTPPAARTMCSVFQIERGSCTIGAPRFLLEERLGQQADDVIALDEPAAPRRRRSSGRSRRPRRCRCRRARAGRLALVTLAVLLQHRVRHAVREIAVRLVVNLGEPKRQLLLEQVDDEARRRRCRRCRRSRAASASPRRRRTAGDRARPAGCRARRSCRARAGARELAAPRRAARMSCRPGVAR